MAEEKKKTPKREGAWWRKYTKEFLDEPEPIRVEQPPARPKMPEGRPAGRQLRIYDPFAEMQRIQQEMDRTFRHIFSRTFMPFPAFPRVVKLHEGVFRKSMVEVRDLGKAVAVRAEMPGVKKDDIRIRLEGRNLILDARSQKKKEEKGERAQSFTQSFVGFRNVIRLPTEVDKKSSRAKYENGILTVILQKKETSGESGDIEVE